MSDDRRLAVSRHVFEAQKCFRVFTDYAKGECWVHPATLKAMKEAESALSHDEFDKAEHMADVVIAMMKRDTVKYQADPKAWLAKYHHPPREDTP